uniref:Uncharacterized protein n=1 Tax=Bracon brevicornis TaxID=1563983 RepID=A0A6V7HMH5_9HYME
MHYLNDTLALSGDGAVQIWRPKTVFNHSL